MRKKITLILMVLALISVIPFSLIGCEYHTDSSDKWKEKYDISLPDFDGAGMSLDSANEEGWYSTLTEEFEGEELNELWKPSPHGVRRSEFWCDEMVSVKNGNAEVAAKKSESHMCSQAICPVVGNFTSGIETRQYIDGVSSSTFEQAFGYFEARVQFPNSDGMWSAFWLQTSTMSNIGNKGMDGSEIDIYESSFWKNKTKVGHCIHYDGYDNKHRAGQATRDTKTDLYDGFHTFALKWTPNEYVFYVDGVATWATDFGGICRVPAFIRLTNEIRPNTTGPYGQPLKNFDGGIFKIDYVKVYQNADFLSEIKSIEDFI